jgi:aryl-alcohol dehydrogenase-like predicted oxidoreductase
MPKRTEHSGGTPSLPSATNPNTSGSASATGTKRFASRRAGTLAPEFFRASRTGLTLSSLAHGTYLGECDDETDAMYAAALRASLLAGVNLIDTAINYRCQRSERLIGTTLSALFAADALARDEIAVCTKAGYIPLDGAPPATREDYASYVRTEYLDTGLLHADDIVGGAHSIAPTFLLDQLQRSLSNLRLAAVDYFYVHNPEQQLTALDAAGFRSRMRAAFEALEGCVASGKITAYGCATWNGLRLPAGSHGHLSLYDVVGIAREVAGDAHHFRIVQLPVNLTMSEAVRLSTQRDPRGRLVRVIDVAEELGVDIVVSAPLLQGQLTHDLPPQVRELFPGATDAQRALAFAGSLPGVLSAAVGMKSTEHVTENLAAFRTP